MKTLLALSVILLGTHGAAAVTHSLKYFYTGSSGIPSFPDFLTVGLVDGQPISYYDSVIRKVIPKQDWMAQSEGPEYWESETQASIGAEPVFKGNIDTAKQRFNQTGVQSDQLQRPVPNRFPIKTCVCPLKDFSEAGSRVSSFVLDPQSDIKGSATSFNVEEQSNFQGERLTIF
ncbi:Major histocompatibility complex class I-related gene protein [Channa argus]|uniref:Major histocompatibility complex class I-related gene protein n=1 Tax=Channa argus TaxID=215402 RepID=A0A6G1QXT0_CHAAH|nr:Major histocompatibility complex class I-related gene protein [Channa argus]